MKEENQKTDLLALPKEMPPLLPETGFLRLRQIIGDKKTIPAIIPVSRSTWWAGVREGRFPKSVKLSKRTTAWRIRDIRALIEEEAVK
jgi:predicted DNA-binding transcriptional regulator AlpA